MPWRLGVGAVAVALTATCTGYVLYQRQYVRTQIAKIPRIATPNGLFDHRTGAARSIAPISVVPLPDAAFRPTQTPPTEARVPSVATTTLADPVAGQATTSNPTRSSATPGSRTTRPDSNRDEINDVTVAGLSPVATTQVDHRSITPYGGVHAENYLIIGTDSRANVPDAQAKTFGKNLVGGSRSDTIFLLRIDRASHQAWALSIPRDTWVHISGTNTFNRVNAAYARGAPTLVRTIQENFDLPISHFAIVDFEGFQAIVSAVGGAKVCFPAALRDTVTGLAQPFGCHVLDPVQAIAFVRSRHAEQQRGDGVWIADPRGDLGRIQRQQAFLRGVVSQGLSQGVFLPTGLSDFLPKLRTALVLDDTFDFDEVKGLADDFRSFDPNALVTDVIPTKPRRVGDKEVLVVDTQTAAAHIGRFGQRDNQ